MGPHAKQTLMTVIRSRMHGTAAFATIGANAHTSARRMGLLAPHCGQLTATTRHSLVGLYRLARGRASQSSAAPQPAANPCPRTATAGLRYPPPYPCGSRRRLYAGTPLQPRRERSTLSSEAVDVVLEAPSSRQAVARRFTARRAVRHRLACLLAGEQHPPLLCVALHGGGNAAARCASCAIGAGKRAAGRFGGRARLSCRAHHRIVERDVHLCFCNEKELRPEWPTCGEAVELA
mmetsp:Transcript_20516/g.66048  ORF Transcript_20516/g.66048 Transcript_20516/m.66048 type:complete len:235 (+) Transcript_20516:75-779(+)